MGLGSTTKKIQMLADTAEQMYHRLNEVREQVETTQHTVQETGDRVKTLESEIVEQRAILNAVAAELDIDLEAVTAEAHITDAEGAADQGDGADPATEASEEASADEPAGDTPDAEADPAQ